MSQIVFDEGLAGRLDAMYRTRDMVRRRRLAREALGAAPGERVVDVGCGPGFYVAELLGEVGSGGRVVGVDASPAMLALAERRCTGRANARFLAANVTSLPLADAGFDAALCVQVLEYVPDVAAALAGMHRALRPGGRLVAWDVDWSTVSWQSRDPARMERVLRTWDAHLTHPSLPRALASRLRSAGFTDVGMTGHAFVSAGAGPEGFGGSLIPLIERFVAGRDGISADDARPWAEEQRQLGADGEFFFCCVQFCFTGVKPKRTSD
jgi:ubiquinone/menaquinone biosynthesis C-methylase UbiE